MISAKTIALLFASCSTVIVFAQTSNKDNISTATDTLSSYRATSQAISYQHASIARQAARFALTLPCKLHEISILMNGASGEFTVRIWGHEGGSSAPLIGQDITEPFVVQKTAEGVQRVTIAVDDRDITINNNQFFVVVENLPVGVYLMSDSEEKKPSCISDNEKFVWQYLQGADGRWQYGRYGFAIDVMVSYPKTMHEDLSFTRDSVQYADSIVSDEQRWSSPSLSCADVDDDGFIDVLANGRLFMNRSGTLVEQTAKRGLGSRARAHCFLDIDNDGDADILLLGVRGAVDSTSRLYVNNRGLFSEVRVSIPVLDNPTSISLADVNQDGYIDIFIGQSVQNLLGTSKNYLLINTGHFSFENGQTMFLPAKVSSVSSSDWPLPKDASTSRGSSFVDLNGDHIPDLYIANYYGKADEVWYNRPGNGFILSNVLGDVQSKESATTTTIPEAFAMYSSGAHWMDVTGDGSPDLLSARYTHPWLLAKEPTAHHGAMVYAPTVDKGTSELHFPFEYEEKQSAGTWGDIDNDGKLDCMLFTSCECRYADLYHQNADGSFTMVTATAGVNGLSRLYDGIWCDINNDGLLDLVSVHNDSLKIFRNNSSAGNGYIDIELQASSFNKQCIGATATVYSGKDVHTQQVVSGRGLLMQDPLRLHYGLAQESVVDSVVVIWPSGHKETFTDVKSNSRNQLKEGVGGNRANSQGVVANLFARPVPFRDIVELSFELIYATHLSVDIYTVDGLPVRNLLSSALETGSHTVVWDGRDSYGGRLPSGTYMYKCSAGGADIVGKIIKID